MKIVITGALGHIGSRLCRDFASWLPGAELVLVDDLCTLRYCSLFNLPEGAKYTFLERDVITDDLRGIAQGAAVVVHLAAITDATTSFQNRDRVETRNFAATAKVAELCEAVGCPMIHLSSTSVYGTQENLVDEACSIDELRPQSPYAETKLREEDHLKQRGLAGALRFQVCRFGTIAGISPGMRFHTAVNKFCWQAVMGEPLTVWSTAMDQKRPYLDLSDATRAIAFIIRKDLFQNGIFNVLTDNLTVREIVMAIQDVLGEVKIELVDAQIMNQLSYEVSDRKFRNEGYEVKGSIKACIAETIKLLEQAGGARLG